jgi:hypothetical protein
LQQGFVFLRLSRFVCTDRYIKKGAASTAQGSKRDGKSMTSRTLNIRLQLLGENDAHSSTPFCSHVGHMSLMAFFSQYTTNPAKANGK